MARLRKKDRAIEDVVVPLDDAPLDVRHAGPWDSSERSSDDDGTQVDLGSLIIRGHESFAIQLPTDSDDGEIGSVVLVGEESALELRAFAATRSGGLWAEVRADLVEEVERLGGESETATGPFGEELHISVPAELPDGTTGTQPSRIVGIEGPRWMLRATFLGDAGANPTDEGILMEALRDVIVVRGVEPRIPREALLLTLPDNAIAAPAEE